MPTSSTKQSTTTNTAYTQEVLGRHVVLEFAVDGSETRPYLGRVCQMKAILLANGVDIETEHLVAFDDGDRVWFDLAEQERLNSLTWINRSVISNPSPKSQHPVKKTQVVKKKQNTCKPASRFILPASDAEDEGDAAPSTKNKSRRVKPPATETETPTAIANRKPNNRGLRQQVCAPRRFTPSDANRSSGYTSNKNKSKATKKRKAAAPPRASKLQTPTKKRKKHTSKRTVTLTPSSPGPAAVTPLNENQIDEPEEDVWISEMEYWINNIPHGKTAKQTTPVAKANTIMTKVRKLAAGEGLAPHLKEMPEDACFYFGVKVDPFCDFQTMLTEATEYAKEHQVGVDNFCQPLRKLRYFQQHRESQPSRILPEPPLEPFVFLDSASVCGNSMGIMGI